MLKRHIASQIVTALSDTPVVLLNGARQTGKSTLVQQLASERGASKYLTLDNAATLAAARFDPTSLLTGFSGTLVIDEVQRAPELYLALKETVDQDRRPGRFLLTGSANVLLLPRLSESLVGRMEIVTLWPFSQGELAGTRETLIERLFAAKFTLPASAEFNRSDLLQRLLLGGYPEVMTRTDVERRQSWFGSYLTTLLQRDVREFANIEGLTDLPRLLALLAARASSLLNLADVSRAISIPQTTLKRYLTLLEMAFLVLPLPAWSNNLGKRLVKAPKLMLNDTGLIAALLGLNEERLGNDGALLGSLLENFVVSEVRKQITWSRTRPQLFHFRTQTGQEVDLVLEDATGKLVGIEVKASAQISSSDFKGLRALQELTGKRFHRGILLYTGTQALPFGPDVYALPLPCLWQAH